MVDYIQLLSSKNSKGPEFRVLEASGITRQLKSIAKELNVLISTFSIKPAVEQRDDKKPILVDLRESVPLNKMQML